MASGFGVDPTKDVNGNVLSGTTSQDIQNIFGGLYTPGIVSGGQVTTSSSTMQYSVAAGVAMVPVSTGQVIPAPIPATSVPVSAGPTSGTRTDIVYVQQHLPAIDGDSQVVIGVAQGVALPPRAVALQTYTVPAGAANTSVATAQGGVNFAVPYSGSLGVLYRYKYGTSGALPNSLTRIGASTFYLPSQRMIRFSASAVLYAQNASGWDNAHYCEYGLLPNIDNGDQVLWSTTGLHQAWANFGFSIDVLLSAGVHTCNLGIFRIVGPGQPMTFSGTDGSGFGRSGVSFVIEDLGVAS